MALATRFTARRGDITLRTGYSNPFFQGDNIPRSTKLLNCRDMSFWEPRFLAKIATPDLQNRSGNIPGARQVVRAAAFRLSAPIAADVCELPWRSGPLL